MHWRKKLPLFRLHKFLYTKQSCPCVDSNSNATHYFSYLSKVNLLSFPLWTEIKSWKETPPPCTIHPAHHTSNTYAILRFWIIQHTTHKSTFIAYTLWYLISDFSNPYDFERPKPLYYPIRIIAFVVGWKKNKLHHPPQNLMYGSQEGNGWLFRKL